MKFFAPPFFKQETEHIHASATDVLDAVLK